jgi:cyclin-dependent kinase-like
MLEVLESNPSGLQPELIQKYIYQLLKAIKYCHKHGIIHRDVKPENLLINSVEVLLKLCDFGFARMWVEREMTDYVATRWYRAPELLLGIGSYSKEVDCWAVGCIMGELIDGQPLFPGESELDQLYLIQRMIGPLTEEQGEAFAGNPRFLGFKFPEIGMAETLEKHYIGKASRVALSFMKGLLKVNPKERLTCTLLK